MRLLLVTVCLVTLAYASPTDLLEKRNRIEDWLIFKCEGREDGFYADLVRGCHQYYSCYDDKKTTHVCQGGMIFNDKIRACMPTNLYSCPSPSEGSLVRDKKTPSHGRPDYLDFKCEGKDDGYYPDLFRNCQVFYLCHKGKKYSFHCGAGTVFDATKKVCNFSQMVDCPEPDWDNL